MSAPLSSTAYFNGNFMPLAEANVNVMTHALNYGTACFEGIRGYWNEEQQQLYLFRMREHYERLVKSCRILTMKAPGTPEELGRITLEMLRRDNPRHDVYIRPLVYKSSLAIGVRLHNVDDGFVLFYALLGKYIDNQSGCRCCTSTYRRVDDNGIPARAKITGIYVNSALAKSEAELNGFDEAIMLTHEGHVSEGSGENIFLIIDGQLVTPAPSENILMGITRASVMELAKRELGIDTIERQVDRDRTIHCRRGLHDRHRCRDNAGRRGRPQARGLLAELAPSPPSYKSYSFERSRRRCRRTRDGARPFISR